MTAVSLGPNKKVVEIPDSLLEKFDKGEISANGLKDWAVGSRQATPQELGFPALTPSEQPSIAGPGQAMMISSGKMVTDLGSNISQLANEVSGNKEAAQQDIENQAEAQKLTAPVREQYPKSYFAGQVLPNFAVPGGMPAQIASSAIQGYLSGDTQAGRVGNAAISAILSYVGAKAGQVVSDKVVPKVQQLVGNKLGEAREALIDAGIPLTPGQMGSAAGKFFDVLKSTVLRRQPLENQQLSQLTKLGAKVLGQEADDLSKPVLSKAASEIGNVYQSVAKNVGEIPIGADEAARFAKIDELLKSVPEPSRVTGALKMVEEMITDPNKGLTGKSFEALRHRLGSISAQLWKQGNGLEAEVVDETISTLDDALAKAAPEAASSLSKAGQQWRFLLALRRGDAVGVNGLINPRAMTSAMEAKYPGFDIGRYPSGEAGGFGRTLDALTQVVRPFKSSGTAERLAGMAAPVAAGLALTGAAGPVAGPAAMLALALSGRGAGPLIGGGMGRSIAQQMQPGVNNSAAEIARQLRAIP